MVDRRSPCPQSTRQPAKSGSRDSSNRAAGDESGIGEVGEHAVDAALIELQVLVHGVAAVVGRQALLLVAEGPRVHKETVRMGPLNEVRSRQQAVGLVDRERRSRERFAKNRLLVEDRSCSERSGRARLTSPGATA